MKSQKFNSLILLFLFIKCCFRPFLIFSKKFEATFFNSYIQENIKYPLLPRTKVSWTTGQQIQQYTTCSRIGYNHVDQLRYVHAKFIFLRIFSAATAALSRALTKDGRNSFANNWVSRKLDRELVSANYASIKASYMCLIDRCSHQRYSPNEGLYTWAEWKNWLYTHV